MTCLHWPASRLVLLAALLLPAPACLALPPIPTPVLQVGGDDFPSLILHVPVPDAAGLPMPLSCAQIRARRVDELDPRWKKVTGRVHLDCDDLAMEATQPNQVATQATAYLLPQTVQFSGIPVVEVRLMHSELWSDRQYLLDRLIAELVRVLPVVAHRHLDGCPELWLPGVYERLVGPHSGIWVYPDANNPARTVYAEEWAD